MDLIDVDEPLPGGALAGVVVLRDLTAEQDHGVEVQAHKQVVKDRAAGVFEVAIDAVGKRGVQAGLPLGVLAIDAGVEAEVYQRSTALSTRQLRIVASTFGERRGLIGWAAAGIRFHGTVATTVPPLAGWPARQSAKLMLAVWDEPSA